MASSSDAPSRADLPLAVGRQAAPRLTGTVRVGVVGSEDAEDAGRAGPVRRQAWATGATGAARRARTTTLARLRVLSGRHRRLARRTTRMRSRCLGSTRPACRLRLCRRLARLFHRNDPSTFLFIPICDRPLSTHAYILDDRPPLSHPVFCPVYPLSRSVGIFGISLWLDLFVLSVPVLSLASLDYPHSIRVTGIAFCPASLSSCPRVAREARREMSVCVAVWKTEASAERMRDAAKPE